LSHDALLLMGWGLVSTLFFGMSSVCGLILLWLDIHQDQPYKHQYMLFCSTCFAPAQTGAKFCNFCGAKIEAKDRSDPWVGKLFAGKYMIQKKLGTGSYGEVYQAESTQSQQRLALKILRKTLLQNPQTISRFQREAIAANRLEHSAALRVYECAQLDTGELYFAMELVDGQSLKQHIEKRTLNMEEFFSVFVPLCEVLHEAHQKGIVHRDLKPDNVMLARVEKKLFPKLLDFGLAGMLGESKLTMTGTVIGTPAYMAPEQWGGLKFADGRSDLYALGTIAFRCLSGRLPFEARSPAEWLKKHKFEIPQDLRSCARWVPQNLSTIVMRLLEKSPTRRFQSAQELRDALLRVQTSLEPTVIGGDDLEETSFRPDIISKPPTKEPTEENPTQQASEDLLAEESFSTVKVSQEPIAGGPSFTMLCLEEHRTLLHVVARGDKVWVSASRGGLYTSQDAGHSWERFLYEKGASLYSLWLGPNEEQLLCGEGGLLLLSQEKYFHALSPQTTHSLYCIWSSPRGVYIAGEQGTLLRKNGDVVFVLRVGDTTLFSGCQSAFGDLIVVGKKGTIHRSTDFGFTWSAKTSNTENDLHAVTASAGEMIAVGKAGTILRSTDRGHSWVQQESSFFEDLYGVGFSPDGKLYAVGGQGTILRRASSSASWEKLVSPTQQDLYSLSFLPNNRLIAVGDSGTVLLASEGN
jgi:serine/threonine protein kinase